jgi:hypothetical protein
MTGYISTTLANGTTQSDGAVDESTLPVSLVDCLTNDMAVADRPAPADGTIIVVNSAGATIYTPGGDSDSARGTALVTALTAAAGTGPGAIHLGAGTFDSESVRVAWPENFSVWGQGIDVTTVRCWYWNGVNNSAMTCANGITIHDMTLNVVPLSSNVNTAITPAAADCQITLVRVRVDYWNDACLVSGAALTGIVWNLYDCQFIGGGDCLNIVSNDCVMNVYRTSMHIEYGIRGGWTASTQLRAAQITGTVTTGAAINLYNCPITIIGGTGVATACCISDGRSDDSAASITAYNCTFSTDSGVSGSAVHADVVYRNARTGINVNVYNCFGSGSGGAVTTAHIAGATTENIQSFAAHVPALSLPVIWGTPTADTPCGMPGQIMTDGAFIYVCLTPGASGDAAWVKAALGAL